MTGDLVTAAAASIDYYQWVTAEDGKLIPQITSPSTIHRMLCLLDVCSGMRVLEIGTGSGYSGALLSRIVGPSGRVVSLDVDPRLVERARILHEQAGHANMEIYITDGFGGWVDGARFDRIVGWATPHVLPRGWVEQTKTSAVIVTPVKIADIAAANAVLRCVVDDEICEHRSELHPGSFIEMAPEIITELGMPIRYVDAVYRPQLGIPWWISGHQLHDSPKAVAEKLLRQLRAAKPEADFFRQGSQSWRAFTAFLLTSTSNPVSLGCADAWGIGTATSGSVAISLNNGNLLAAGSNAARDDLAGALKQWHELGEPDFTELTPSFSLVRDGWEIRAQRRR